MRGLVALVSRETRDARWHLVAALAFAVAVPFVVVQWPLDSASDEIVAKICGRVVVPLLFALFAASTASELVARDVATKRIDALAVLPVPIARVWTAKALFLAAASALFLAWVVAAELGVVAWVRPGALARLPDEFAAAVPTLLVGIAFGAASLFFSTLLERGMTAALAAIVVLVTVACAVQWAEIPAAPGVAATLVASATPLAFAAAFVVASRTTFVRGPIHAASKVRIAIVGLGVLAAITVPAAAATAIALERTTRLAPGEGDPALRRAFLSPNGKWVAIEDASRTGASRTWIVGVDDGSCRLVGDGRTWFGYDGAWLPESSLRVASSSFSLLEGPCCARTLDIEPTRLDVLEEHARGHYDPRLERAAKAGASAGRVTVRDDGDVMLLDEDGATLRRLFPPKER